MTVLTVLTEANALLAALNPTEKWQAVRRLGNSFAGEPVFAVVCGMSLIVLTVMFIAVSYKQRQRNLRAANELFSAYADRRGLSRRESQMLMTMATKAQLRRNESIFTMADVFNQEAAKAIDETMALNGTRKSKRLRAELSVLREKLGFEQQFSDSLGLTVKAKKPGSRQISVGKKIQVRMHNDQESDSIEATVLKNDEIEFTVKLSTPLEAEAGDLCCIHYYFETSVWEFDTSVLSCHGGILVLTHTNDVRFINRRRFIRVPVRLPAYIASFPFARTFPPRSDRSEWNENVPMNGPPVPWGPPEFVPAEVTELAGPGMRIEAPLDVEVGDRVVVILKMRDQFVSQRQGSLSQPILEQRSGKTSSIVVEGVGEVRRIEAIEKGFSIAVELTGLSDSNVNELVRETNSALVSVSSRKQDTMTGGKAESDNMNKLAEHIAV